MCLVTTQTPHKGPEQLPPSYLLKFAPMGRLPPFWAAHIGRATPNLITSRLRATRSIIGQNRESFIMPSRRSAERQRSPAFFGGSSFLHIMRWNADTSNSWNIPARLTLQGPRYMGQLQRTTFKVSPSVRACFCDPTGVLVSRLRQRRQGKRSEKTSQGALPDWFLVWVWEQRITRINQLSERELSTP
jgi:hypothetical protein